jgi:hypothetical protein
MNRRKTSYRRTNERYLSSPQTTNINGFKIEEYLTWQKKITLKIMNVFSMK